MFLKSILGVSYSTHKRYLSGGFCPGGGMGVFVQGGVMS